jgi:hypothetical protein
VGGRRVYTVHACQMCSDAAMLSDAAHPRPHPHPHPRLYRVHTKDTQ